MKKLLFIAITVLFGTLGLFSQTASTMQGCFPLSVDFTAPGGSSTYFWDFDDGATSTLGDPSHTFITTGTFVVEFSESVGGAVVGTVIIEVYAPPTPTFSSDVTQGCAPLQVSFDNTTVLQPGINILGYSWVYGDGGNDTGASASHSFATPGSYSVSLGLTTNLPSCNVTELVPDFITVTTPPVVSFSSNPDPPISCTAPAVFGFTNNSSSSNPLTYNWDFDNGQTSTALNPPTQNFATEGSYTVVLTATDDNECSQSSQLIVGVGQPTASFQAPDTFCINVETPLVNLSPTGAFLWNFGPGAFPVTSPLANPVTTFSTPGFHDITLTILGDCPDDTTITVFVEEVSAEFISSPTYSCSSPMTVNFTPLQTGLNYLWIFNSADSLTTQMPTYTYAIDDTTTYSINGPRDSLGYFVTELYVTSAAGCMAEYSSIDTIHEPNALAFPNLVEGCSPVNVTFADSSNSFEEIIQWEYIFGDGTSVTYTDYEDQMHTYVDPGEYEFYSIITNAAGCTDTSFVQIIQVGEPITPVFTVSTTEVCPGESVQFTDLTPASDADNIDAWHYTTENSLMFHCFQEPNPSWVFENETGPQDVTLTVEYNGCYSSTTQTGLINVLGPIADMSFVCDCDNPYTIEFINNSQDYSSVLWDFGDGMTSTDSEPTHTYAMTGDFNVTLQAINTSTGCEDSFHTMTVHIRDIETELSLDSLVCQGADVTLQAVNTQDVYENCYHGYTYSFSDPTMRPITVANPIAPTAFPNTGDVTVYLEVTDINGCTAEASSVTRVFGIEAAYDITPLLGGPEICFPSTVSFDDLSSADTTIVNWNWSFGDGQVGSGAPIDHVYEGEDQVTGDPNYIAVVLTITDAIGCASDQVQVINFYTPVSAITFSDDAICSGDSVAFTATDFTSMGSMLTYEWDFANGNTSNQQNPALPFSSGGDYLVNLVFEEVSTGCFDSTQVTIQVADFPLAGFMSAVDSVAVICPNENVVFMDTTIFNGGSAPAYNWDFGNGSTSTFPDPGTFFADNGDYTVQLYVEIPAPFGCADSTSQEYTVYGPMGSFTTDIGNEAICRTDEVLFTIDSSTEVDTFYWDFGDGILGPGISPISHQYNFVPPSGQTFAAMVMSNDDGSCPLIDEVPINIHEVVADFDRNFNDLDTALCFQPFPLTNVSLNSDQFYWDFGDGSTTTDENPLIHEYADPGTYLVTLGVFNELWGCTDTIQKAIVLHPIPELFATGDTICEGELGFIDVIEPNPLWDYAWTSPSTVGIDDPADPNTSSQPLLSTDYYVMVTDTNTCTMADTVNIVVINPPEAEDLETIVPIGDIVILPVTIDNSIYIYDWTPDSITTNCLTCDPAWVQAFVDQVYNVTITDIRDCFTTEAEFIINVHPETFVTIPTTFTPNGDGVNDIIYVEGWGVKELIEYKIFNRWGEMIFESNSMSRGWDGKYKGVLQNSDVYVYKVTAKTWLDEQKTLEGHINLMR